MMKRRHLFRRAVELIAGAAGAAVVVPALARAASPPVTVSPHVFENFASQVAKAHVEAFDQAVWLAAYEHQRYPLAIKISDAALDAVPCGMGGWSDPEDEDDDW